MTYQVEIPETGDAFTVEEGETVLAAAQRAGILLTHDCQLGTCGTCRVRVLAGKLRYEDWPFVLTPEEDAEGYGLACQGIPCADLVLEPARATPALPEPRRTTALVTGVAPLCEGVTHLMVELSDGGAPEYLAGQYMNLHLGDGVARSFSMGSAPSKGVLDFHVRRIPGGSFSDRLIATLRPGDRLDVELPLGSFVYRPEDYRPLLMVATGTGIAPIKSILESLLDDPDCPPVHLYWGMRQESDLYLDAEIRSWEGRLYEFRYVPVLSRAGASWEGRRGYVQDAVLADFEDMSEFATYLCGSPAMIFDAKQAFIGRGASTGYMYAEGFTSKAPVPAADASSNAA